MVVCRLQEFKGTLDKIGEDQEGEVHKQVTGPSVCKCGIQKWPQHSNVTAKWTPNSESE